MKLDGLLLGSLKTYVYIYTYIYVYVYIYIYIYIHTYKHIYTHTPTYNIYYMYIYIIYIIKKVQKYWNVIHSIGLLTKASMPMLLVDSLKM